MGVRVLSNYLRSFQGRPDNVRTLTQSIPFITLYAGFLGGSEFLHNITITTDIFVLTTPQANTYVDEGERCS